MPNNALQRILYVEDDEALSRLLQKRMERQRFSVDLASTAEEGLKFLNQQAYDLVLVDYNLPGMSGLEMLHEMAQMRNPPPSIILTASGDERIALAALEKGASDYAVKDTGQTYLDLLPAVMQAAFTREKLLRENERQRHELELAVEKAEAANQAKSNFLATMSHEIRTPLNVVTGLSNILIRTVLNDEQKKIVQTLQNNADILLKIINDLLDISRIEAGQVDLEKTDFSVTSLLEDVRIMFTSQMVQKNLEYIIEDHTAGRIFEGDRTRIQQIIMNLVSNAVKFTKTGMITITANTNPVNLNGYGTLVLEVTDTGIGIAEEKLPTIFDKFTQADETITRRFGGSGLGLSIARALAELMQGSISVQTEINKGSSFCVKLILKERNNSKMNDTTESPLNSSHQDNLLNGTVFVVEDYVPNIMVVTMMLEDLGLNVITAENGQEAIDIISSSTQPFLAILMDVQMHDLDGLETTRRIRKLENTLGMRNTIIGVTAHALAGDRERCISAGMDDYISKPIHPDILTAKLTAIAEKGNSFITSL